MISKAALWLMVMFFADFQVSVRIHVTVFLVWECFVRRIEGTSCGSVEFSVVLAWHDFPEHWEGIMPQFLLSESWCRWNALYGYFLEQANEYVGGSPGVRKLSICVWSWLNTLVLRSVSGDVEDISGRYGPTYSVYIIRLLYSSESIILQPVDPCTCIHTLWCLTNWIIRWQFPDVLPIPVCM